MSEIRPVGPARREWLHASRIRLFRGDIIVSRGRVHRPLELPGVVAHAGNEPLGAATCEIRGDPCQLVSLDALRPWQGIGAALLPDVERAAGAAACSRAWLIPTNDNTDALRFCMLARSSRAGVRSLRPRGRNRGIPVRDELELEKPVRPE